MRLFNKYWIIPFLFSLSVFSQDTESIRNLHDLYNKNKFKNLIKANEYANQSVNLSVSLKNDSLKLLSNYYLIEVLYKQRKIKEVKQKLNTCINLAKKINNTKILCLSYVYSSKVNRRLQNYTESLKNLEDAYKIAILYNYTSSLHKIANAKAFLYTKTNNYRKAISLLRKIIKNDEYQNLENSANSHNILGILYFNSFPIQNKDSSAYFYKKGIDVIEGTNKDYTKSGIYLNYGDLLLQKQDYKKALYYLNLAEKKSFEISAYSNLYFINVSLGIYFFDTKNYKKSIEKFQIAIQEYGKYADGDQLSYTYWLLADALYFNNQFKEGYLFQEKVILLKDSLFTINKNKTFEKLQTEYEVAHKNTRIALLEKQKELESQRKKIILTVSFLLLIPAILLIIIYRYRIKAQKIIQLQELKLHEQEKEQLEQQQKIERIEGYIAGEEKEKNRISLELHDGIGGQLAGIKHYANCLGDSKEKEILQKNLMNVTKEVRLLSHSLSYNYSMQHSINDLLQVLQEQYKNHFTIEFFIYPEERLSTISDKNKLFLYRTLQEVINNIYKYAKANTVTISLTITDELVLIIEDDGVGFDEKKIKKGIGIQNIKERVANLLGEFSIDTTPNRGVSIIIKIPCN